MVNLFKSNNPQTLVVCGFYISNEVESIKKKTIKLTDDYTSININDKLLDTDGYINIISYEEYLHHQVVVDEIHARESDDLDRLVILKDIKELYFKIFDEDHFELSEESCQELDLSDYIYYQFDDYVELELFTT
jgi:hypothetical protein